MTLLCLCCEGNGVRPRLWKSKKIILWSFKHEWFSSWIDVVEESNPDYPCSYLLYLIENLLLFSNKVLPKGHDIHVWFVHLSLIDNFEGDSVDFGFLHVLFWWMKTKGKDIVFSDQFHEKVFIIIGSIFLLWDGSDSYPQLFGMVSSLNLAKIDLIEFDELLLHLFHIK
jgi:hypothetical protein